MTMKERYGVEDLTFEEELKLYEEHPNLARTRSSKIRLVETTEKIKGFADQLNGYCKCIPELDEDHHSKLVKEFADKMESLWREIDKTVYDMVHYS